MKNTMITELVQIRVAETITGEQLLDKAEALNGFLVQQDGYIDGTLLKGTGDNAWCFIFHFENLEKVKAIGENLRGSREFADFKTLLVPGSLAVSFFHPAREWQVLRVE